MLAMLLIFVLSGCVGDHAGRQVVDQAKNTPAPTIAERVPAEIRAEIVELRHEIQSSNNATQQSQQLGVQVAKIAEKVDAALVKIESSVNASLFSEIRAQAELTAQLRAEIRSEVKASAEISVNAVASLKADIETKLQADLKAVAQANAGIGNRLDSLQQSFSSGRDTNTTQFTKEMADTLMSGSRQVLWVVVALAGGAVLVVVAIAAVLCFFLEKSRARAERRGESKGVHA